MPKGMAKYEKIKLLILDEIQAGRYPCGSRLPSEFDLCKTFNTSRITVRRALDELAGQGALEKRQGVGSFVLDMEAARKIAKASKIAVIFPAHLEMLGSGSFSDMVRGMESVLEKENCVLVGISGLYNSIDTGRMMHSLTEIAPAGIIYPFFSGDRLSLESLKKLEIPVVLIGSSLPDSHFDYVGGDNYNSAYRAAKLMLDKGLKTIGFFSPVNTSYTMVYDRLRGVKSALGGQGVHISSRLFYTGSKEALNADTIDHLGEIRAYLTRNRDLDGVIVNTDTVAYYFYLVCSELGVKIPQDLKIISYGNYYAENRYMGGLTSYETYSRDCGRQAATLLLQRIKYELPPGSQTRDVYYDLIRRASF